MKAKMQFSHGGKVYQEGQEVDIADESVLKKFKEQGLVSEGKGKSAEDVQKENDDALEAEKKKNADLKAKADAAEAERQEKNSKAGPPTVKVKDETKK